MRIKMLRAIIDEENERSILNWAVRKNFDYNADWIKRNVPDWLTQLIMMEKYKNLQKTSNSSSALHHDMVQRVLPSVAEFINKRFEFLPQKRDSLIDTLNSFKKVLLERGGMYTVAREDDNDEYNVGDDNDEPV